MLQAMDKDFTEASRPSAERPHSDNRVLSKSQHLIDIYSSHKGISQDTWPPASATTFIKHALVNNTEKGGYYNDFLGGDIHEILARKENIEYEEVFGQYESQGLVLVEGCPGSGKSTLVYKIARDWATTENILRNANMVFYISLKRLAKGHDESLQGILANFYQHKEADLDKVCKDIEKSNGNGVCFIIDGVDEYQRQDGSNSVIFDIIHKRYLPTSMVIVASQPMATAKLREEAPVTKQISVLGFTQEQIFEYIDKVPLIFDRSNLIVHLHSHRNILHMCYLPVHIAMICHMYEEQGCLPPTETKFHGNLTRYIILCQLRCTNKRTKLRSLEDLLGENKKDFRNVCCLAFDMTIHSEQVVLQDEVEMLFPQATDPDYTPSLGLINIAYTDQDYTYGKTYSFLHLSFQEYLAALHLAMLNEEEQEEMIRLHAGQEHMRMLWKFYCGMVEFEGKQAQLQLIMRSAHPLYRVQCAWESQQAVVCDHALETETGTLNFSHSTLTPSDLTAVGYTISTTSHPITELAMSQCDLHDDHVEVFLGGVSNNKLKCLRRLDLTYNHIGNDGAATLAMTFESSDNLQSLWLSDNNIGDHGATALAMRLKSCSNLQSLGLSANNISSDAVTRLNDELKAFSTLNEPDIQKYNDYLRFIKEKETVDLRFLKIVFLGLPGLGKTTLLRRLTGEIDDLLSAGEAEKSHPSTGTVESGPSVMVRCLTGTTALVTESEWSTLNDLTEESRMLLDKLFDLIKTKPTPADAMETGSTSSSHRETTGDGSRVSQSPVPPFQSHQHVATPKESTRTSGPSSVAPLGTPTSAPSSVAPLGTPTSATSSVTPLGTPTSAPSSVTPLGTPTSATSSVAPLGTPTSAPSSVAPLGTPTSAPSSVTPLGTPTSAPSSVAPLGIPTSAPSSLAPLSTPTSAPSLVTPPTSTKHKENPEVVAMFREALKMEHLKALKGSLKAHLRMEDTGGQPELMDMLPALTAGPGLYLLFVNLQCDLHKKYTVSFRSQSGESTAASPSTYSMEEMLLSALSSISCSSTSTCITLDKTEKATDSVMVNILKSSKSVAYIVGTHKDKVTDKEIEEFDHKIKKVIESTDFYKKEIIRYSSTESNQLVVAMDNMEGGKKEIKKIRKLMEDAIEEQFEKLSIPVSWLAFSLCLRRIAGKTAAMEYCLELSKQFQMSDYETKVALWFLHHHAGIMMYFPDIPLLEDLVIIDPQIVYDSVTELILRALRSGRVHPSTSKKFRETGQFSLEDLEKITANISGDHIPVDKLLALLKFLHIVASFTATDGRKTYIMPCVLESASKEELNSNQEDDDYPHPLLPIMIRYKCGFVPIGVFPAITAGFIGGGTFELIEEGIKKNRVQFLFGKDYDKVTFIARPTYYEIRIARTAKPNCQPHKVCTDLRREVESTFKKVSGNMNYGSILDYQFSFECPTHNGREHLCVIKEGETSPQKMLCLGNPQKSSPKDMKPEHLVWYDKQLPEPSPGDSAKPLTERQSPSPRPSTEDVSSERAQSNKWFRMPKPIVYSMLAALLFLLLALGIKYQISDRTTPVPMDNTIPTTAEPRTRNMDSTPFLHEMHNFQCYHRSVSFRIIQHVATDCWTLGIMLRIPSHIVNIEWGVPGGHFEEKCSKTMEKWLSGIGSKPITWRTFVAALRTRDFNVLADDLETDLNTFLSPPQPRMQP